MSLLMGAKLARVPDYDPCDYHAGHQCRKCDAHITDMEIIESGLFLSLCSPCLARSLRAMRSA